MGDKAGPLAPKFGPRDRGKNVLHGDPGKPLEAAIGNFKSKKRGGRRHNLVIECPGEADPGIVPSPARCQKHLPTRHGRPVL